MEVVTDRAGLDELIAHLRASGRRVIGPTVRDGVITHDEIHDTADLPHGRGDVQQGGSYRLRELGTEELFGFSSPSQSWKRFVFAPRTLLIRSRRAGNEITVEEPERPTNPVAFFGVRSCDLAGLHTLDQVFLGGDYPDASYAANRTDVFVVAAGCARPASTCFCASMNTGPNPTTGYDIDITELSDDDGLRYLLRPGSERGGNLLTLIDAQPATPADHTRAEAQHVQAVDMMQRGIKADDPAKAALDPDHPRWADVAERCLACGNCTMVCPTCFCSTTEDQTSLDGTEAERWQVWDSCFTLDFTQLHGGSTRTSTASRYRQWLLHKLVTWHDQFDMSGCVGCGRCIAWCPVGIDLTEEVAALALEQQAPAQSAPTGAAGGGL